MRIREVRTIPVECRLPQPVFDANYIMAEMVFPAHPLMAELVKQPLAVDHTGHIELSDRPGLGLELDPQVVARYRVDR